MTKPIRGGRHVRGSIPGKLRKSLPDNIHPILREIFQIAEKKQYAIRELALRSGYDYSTLNYLRTGARVPNIYLIDDVLQALGYHLVVQEL